MTWFHRTRRAFTLLTAAALLITALPLVAGAAGTFWDDDGNPHEPMIEAIAADGVTNGCGSGLYCPDAAVTRAEMASFLVRAFGLTASSDNPFTDLVNSPHAADIRALAASGITTGCATDRYCPSQLVTRGEMAEFLTRARSLERSAPDAFADDDGHPHESAINAIAAAGITNGCSGSSFCPFGAVRRDEMASFLGRALGLDPVAPAPSTRPAGDVYVTPGQDLGRLIGENPEGTVFVFAAGVHSVNNVAPKSNQQFIGEDGAVWSGGNSAVRAMGGSASGVVLQNLIVENYASGAQGAALHPTGTNWTVTGCEIRNNAAVGLSFNGGWLVKDNYIHHNLQLGIKGYGNGAIVENNVITDNNYTDAYDYGWEAGASKFIRTTDLTLRNNVVRDNHGPGLWADTENIGTLYEGNVIENNHGPGILHEVSGTATIRNNTLRGNADEFYFGGILLSSSRDVTVTGNVLEGNDGGIVGLQDDRAGWDGPAVLDNITVTDNTVSYTSGISGVWSNVGLAPYSRNITFDRNIYAVSHARPFQWNGEGQTWEEWRSFGQDLSGSLN